MVLVPVFLYPPLLALLVLVVWFFVLEREVDSAR